MLCRWFAISACTCVPVFCFWCFFFWNLASMQGFSLAWIVAVQVSELHINNILRFGLHRIPLSSRLWPVVALRILSIAERFLFTACSLQARSHVRSNNGWLVPSQAVNKIQSWSLEIINLVCMFTSRLKHALKALLLLNHPAGRALFRSQTPRSLEDVKSSNECRMHCRRRRRHV